MSGTPIADLPHAVAVIGLAGRFPSAPDIDAFWQNLRTGRDGIARFKADELEAAGIARATFEHPDYVPAGGILDDIDCFDADLFGISAHEAALIDPQHRLFLECAWTALEGAGYPPGKKPLAVGVFAGASLGSYLSASPGDLGSGRGAAQLHSLIGNDKDYLTTRTSHRLNLTGPSIGVQTACSTSLVAVHLACQSLVSGECDMALAGGVSISIPQTAGYRYQDGLILSPDGRCRPFDAAAGGTLGGNGVGVVLLKPLAQALVDGDPIRAVIRGSAVNNDGSDKVGYTAPSVAGQMRVVREALALAELPAASIGYVEAHGTGTALGDPIEVEALTRAFAVEERGVCALGSVKSNLGHLDAAAGIASLIKTVLALEAGEVPPTLHYERPNARIDFPATPFFVAKELLPWPERGGPRRAGVSSFGFGGTNAHLVLEQAPAAPSARPNGSGEPVLLVLSASSREQVEQLARRYEAALIAGPAPSDLALTAALHRRAFPARAAIVAEGADALRTGLAGLAAREGGTEVTSGDVAAGRGGRIAFQFSGQGGLSAGAALGLYVRFPAFRAALDAHLADRAPEVRAFLLDARTGEAGAETLQSALLAYQLALVAMWRAFGIRPSAVLGHSIGEMAAAVVSGALSGTEVSDLVATRGRLTVELVRPGVMHAILASEEQVRAACKGQSAPVAIAAVNGPSECVVAGDTAVIDRLVGGFEREGVTTRRLAITHPFHAPNVTPMLPALLEAARSLAVQTPDIPFVSSRYGRGLQSGERLDAAYWAAHLREPVRYADALAALDPRAFDLILEIGPRATLTKLCQRNWPDARFVASAEGGVDPVVSLLRALGRLFCAGADVAWGALYDGHPDHPRRISAPTYPFARDRHWHPGAGRLNAASVQPADAAPWGDVVAAAQAQSAAGSPIIEAEHHAAREAAVEALSAAGAARAFAELGFRQTASEPASADTIAETLGIAVRHRQLTRRLLDGLVEAGRLSVDGDRFHDLLAPDEAEIAKLRVQAEAAWHAWPAMRQITLDALDRFAAALSGSVDPREILFGDGSADAARAVYSEMPNARYFNGILREAVRAFVEARPRGRALRVLEIGGGTAATTERLLPLLPPARARYVFTDVSPLFLRRAETRFSDFPFLTTALLDIGRPPVEQGFEPASFDLIVAANVLHVASDLGGALEHVRWLLAEGGLALAYEIVRPTMIGEITTGLLLPEIRDTDRRGVQPMASEAVWRRAFAEAGFDEVAVLPSAEDPSACLPERVLMARADTGETAGRAEPVRSDVCYRTEWDLSAPLLAPEFLAGEEWILAAHASERRDNLAAEIRRRGGRVIIVPALEDSGAVARFARSLDPAPARRRFVDLRSTDRGKSDASAPSPGAVQKQLCGGLLEILAGFDTAGVAPGDLRIVTAGSQSVRPDDRVAIEAAPLWGMARVVALGHPELGCRQIDIDPTSGDDAERLLVALAAEPAETLLVLRGADVFVPRLRRVRLDALPKRSFTVAPNGWHVIAGGLGGLGLTVAGWLSDRGARHIAILARSEPDARRSAAIRAIAAKGCDIRVLRADITDRPRVEDAFGTLADTGLPIRSIYHCAVARSVGTNSEGWDAFHAILAPKVEGAWALHEISLARNLNLDAFVLFSSSVSVAPAFGMPDYVAANTFLDALAQERRALGLPALSVSWGAWRDVGAVADPAHAEHLRRGGLRGFEPDHAIALLEAALQREAAHLAILDADWSRMLRQYGEGQIPPVFADVLPASKPVPPRAVSGRDDAFLDRLHSMSAEERPEALRSWLTVAFGALLSRPAAAIAPDINLIEAGVDSLMFIEMASDFGIRLGLTLSPSELLRHFTIAAMAERILPMLLAATPELDEPSVASLLVHRPQERFAPFSLTDVQQAYWIGRRQELDLGNTACQGYTELDCRDLDIERLEAAWQRVVARHEMLRVVVLPEGRQQIIEAPDPYRIPVLDLRDLSEEARVTRLEALRRTLSHRVRPTDRWPLWDVQITLLDARRSRLHVGIDNVAIDGRSIGIVLSEWIAFYRDPDGDLPAPGLSFRDYVLAFEDYRRTPGYGRAQCYWQARLTDLPTAPELPLVRDPATIGEPRFVRHSLKMEADAWRRLKASGGRNGLTPAGLLLAAYAEVLARWSKSPRLTINAPVFTRLPVAADINDVVGEFTSNILVGCDMSGDAPFVERARAVQAQLFRDIEHGAVSGIEVVRSMMRAGADARAGAMPVVFTSTFGLALDADTSYAGNVSAFSAFGREVFSISQTPQVWLDNHVHDLDGGLGVNWDVVEGLFAPGVIEAMFEAYRDLLERLTAADTSEAADPASADPWSARRPLRLPPAQLAARTSLNDTAADLGPDALLHAAILEQARATPERIALVDPERSLTYADLAAEAEALAAELDARLGPPRQADARVALALHKGWRQAVAVLAVLVCGRAYVPLDPDLPPARRQAILAQARPDAVLTEHGLIEALRTDVAACAEPACPVLGVDPRPEAVLAPCPPSPRAAPDDLAYVIFTSGSTGLPKGVMIAHAAALNTVRDLNARLGLGPEDAVFGLSALSFDLSVYDLFGPLSRGGRLILPAPGEARDPRAWAARMRAHPVTVWNTVPALWQMLVEHAPRLPAPPRAVLLSGDWIPLELIPRSRALYPDSRLIALGGATEAAIWSVIHPIKRAPDPDWPSVPYGRPLANQRLHVLGPDLSPRPDWVAGDLYIAGSGLARGYLGDAARTAASFVRHPESGERLYRTGDLARVRPEGDAGFTVEFLGREDQQVKVGGHRIELGEIEAVLSGCSGVSGAVAAVRGAAPGPRHLAAWVVAREAGSAPDLADLWSALRARLPAYMVPRSLGLIDALPLSQNGKIDRTKLPTNETQSETIAKGEPPDSPAERILAAAWAAVLEDASPSRGDHFFECGGDSLRAVRMVNRLRDAHHQALPLMQVFADPVLARLAMHLRPIAAALVLEPITTADANGRPIFCIGDALSEGAAFRPLAATWTGERALVAVPGRIDDEGGNALAHTVAATIEALRAWQGTGPYTLAGYSTGGLIAWEIAAVLERAGETIDGLILIDSRPLPLSLAEDGDTLRRILAQIGVGSALEPVLRRTVKAGAQARLSPITAPVLLLEAENQPEELPPLREAWSGAEAPQRDPALHAVTVGGDHFTCLHPPHAEAVAEAIARFITACPLEAAR